MPQTFTAVYESPIGSIEIKAEGKDIVEVNFVEKSGLMRPPGASAAGGPEALRACLSQLEQYFRGKRTSFSLPLKLEGTAFQKKVWAALLRVPFGKTTTYGAIAAALGNKRAGRAVGGANHRNPASIIVPCHRVIGSDGRLTGYGGGLWRKEWLLDHEKKHARD
ncbi:MAG: methylated-DNA--[protein]-cysteine S-methyltransferase [Candidatus Aminicenantales bacterium]|jgi:methylated-DNA-[protein]-cysteine S-methyltransferase